MTLLGSRVQRAHRMLGIGVWQGEPVAFDAPAEYWCRTSDPRVGAISRPGSLDGPSADDGWLTVAEYVIDPGGVVRMGYSYQYCEDFPEPRVLAEAMRLSRSA
jgi:hypothetical protein